MDINDCHTAYCSNATAETLTALFNACRSYAYGLARAYNVKDADDAVAEAVASAWANLSSYEPRPGSSFRAWFRTIIRNRLLNDTRTGWRVFQEFSERTIVPGRFDATYRRQGLAETIVRTLPEGSIEFKLCELVLDGDTILKAAAKVGLSGSAARKRLRRLAVTLDKK